jgi:RNA polymerase sigma-70 factor (ECF subfamily)
MKPSEYDALSDEQLAELFKTRRDQAAFEALVSRHEPGVFRSCLRLLTRNQDAARDTSQVVFTRVARHIGTFRGENFAGWVFRIMRNECMNVLARERGTERLTAELENSLANDAGLASHPLTEILFQELPLLPPGQQSCLKLLYMDGYSYGEIAALLSIEEGMVKSHVQNGRKALRKKIERRLQENQGSGRMTATPVGK